MVMIRVKVEPAYDSDWLYYDDAWKDYVCHDFDNKVVILTDSHHQDFCEADWWRDACIMDDALEEGYYDHSDDFGDYFVEYYGTYDISGISKGKATVCAKLYGEWEGDPTDTEFIVELAEILHPELDLEIDSIRGSVQGDYAEVIYVAGSIDVDVLEDYYFGNLVCISVYSVYEDDDGDEEEEHIVSSEMSYSEYEDINDIEAYVRDITGDIPPDEEIEIIDNF